MRSTTLPITFLLLTSLGLIGCNDETSAYFQSNGRLKGTVLFNNLETSTRDTAYAAELRLYPKASPNQVLNVPLTKGKFDIPNLQEQDYVLKGTFSTRLGTNQTYLAYSKEAMVKPSQDTANVILQPDFTSISAPTLQLTVTNATGIHLPNARVCLYPDSLSLLRGYRTCTGSLRSGTTNTNGVVVFTALQAQTYYAAVTAVAGPDSLSNVGVGRISLGGLIAGRPNVRTVRVTSASPAFQSGLELTVTDAAGYVLSGTRVCLYTSATQIKRLSSGCVNSLRSADTNAQGQVLFSGLQALPYYVLAVRVLGRDTLTNLAGSPVPIGPLTAPSIFHATVIVRP
jgi:hypothetical protein